MKLLFNWLIRCGAGKWDSSARKRHALHWSLGDGRSMDTDEQEISAIEQGFRQVIISSFIRFCQDTSGDQQTKWGDGAVIRFRRELAGARAARAIALKVIEEVIK
jgi:hypothetical protein